MSFCLVSAESSAGARKLMMCNVYVIRFLAALHLSLSRLDSRLVGWRQSPSRIVWVI